ncbi:MAG: NAD(P)/FAD-dependent oxidoreductase [Bacilli bacterium]|jgi:pyruvate/2-oxoglutarate dehydrogenase complex dihydrolipoamide dehydrogenase (E3) component|nr:NAD(P)/FAD-dependent oxidoreductase [Bacilli bacterium]
MDYDVIVIGGGPAGLAAAKSAADNGARTLLIEREAALGGILKQCIHDGFGVTRYGEKLAGPEYAYREVRKLRSSKAEVSLLTFVTRIEKLDPGFAVTVVKPEGVFTYKSGKLILATGCRERTSKQVSIHGTNPTGVMTAGQCQYYINIMGLMPVRKCVILGSGDIGLIMARRITLEGGEVEGVYEAKSVPSGLARNIAQCLTDFSIPLHLSHTVTRVFGVDRLEAVEIAEVDAKMNPIERTERIVKCDSLILSVGLIPENELAKTLGVPLSPLTKGPVVDQEFMTEIPGIYTCGNAMHVNDLADYVSESGEIAGKAAATTKEEKGEAVRVEMGPGFGYVVPEVVDFGKNVKDIIFYFRVKETFRNKTLKVYLDNEEILKRPFLTLRPPEMERLVLSLPRKGRIRFELEDMKK